MAEKKQRKSWKLKPEVKGILIFTGVILAAIIGLLVYQSSRTFRYEECLDTVIVIIDDTIVDLKEISYYVMEVENAGDTFARQYDPENPVAYWKLFMNEASQAGYVTDLARDAALNYCIRDNIYFLEAAKEGVELTKEEQEAVRADAEEYYFRMTLRQRDVTQLLTEDIELILTKVAITQKYMLQLASQEDVSALEAITLHYDVGGDEYERIKSSYSIEVNERIWNMVVPGHVTIN